MSSPSTTAGGSPKMPGAGAARSHQIAALVHARAIGIGVPVTDLPRMIEPVAPLANGRRPPRQRFLAPVTPNAPVAKPRQLELLEIPKLVEPEPVPEPVRPKVASPAAAPPRRRARLALLATAGIVALGLAVTAADIAGLRPFPLSRARHFPISAAPSDPAKRFAYFQEGAQAGDTDAQLQLAIAFAKGDGVAQDYTAAANWFRAAADHGVPRAQYDMGVLTERGRGVKIDLVEAAGWYRKAAQAGYPLAQYNLAVCYTKGQGIRQDLAEAALWYRRAATQGVVQAMINLAMMYEKGDGVTASPVDAYAWYLAAGRRDNQQAARHAEDLYATLPHLDQIRAEALASDVAASIHDPDRDNADAAGAAGR